MNTESNGNSVQAALLPPESLPWRHGRKTGGGELCAASVTLPAPCAAQILTFRGKINKNHRGSSQQEAHSALGLWPNPNLTKSTYQNEMRNSIFFNPSQKNSISEQEKIICPDSPWRRGMLCHSAELAVPLQQVVGRSAGQSISVRSFWNGGTKLLSCVTAFFNKPRLIQKAEPPKSYCCLGTIFSRRNQACEVNWMVKSSD